VKASRASSARAPRRGAAQGRRAPWLVLAAAFVAAAGCAAQTEDEASDESEIRELEREQIHIDFRGEPRSKTLPLFRTWLGSDEIERMFAKMYDDLGKDRRKNGEAPTAREIDQLFDWNAKSLGPSNMWEYMERIEKVKDSPSLDGLAGNGRTGYSPGFVGHLLSDYRAIAGCKDKIETFDLATPPASAKNFTTCLSQEFPTDAAVIKQSWRRNDELIKSGLPVADTSAHGLRVRLSGQVDEGGWFGAPAHPTQATPEDAYTVRLSDRSASSLIALHVMTKELRHWVWVTLWWSPREQADLDFGQDRPEAIKQLGAPWNNYKMCVVTEYDERDPDPRGGFDGTLGDALEASHGRSTWCSNPFLEKGPHNAQTNCIGCHQHGGDVRTLDKVLTTFADQGKPKIREAFPFDYSWAFATPPSPGTKDRLLDVVWNRVNAYAGE
jgi:hypothetical protein